MVKTWVTWLAEVWWARASQYNLSVSCPELMGVISSSVGTEERKVGKKLIS